MGRREERQGNAWVHFGRVSISEEGSRQADRQTNRHLYIPHTYARTHTYLSTYLSKYTHTHTYIQIHTHTYIYIYIHIYISSHQRVAAAAARSGVE